MTDVYVLNRIDGTYRHCYSESTELVGVWGTLTGAQEHAQGLEDQRPRPDKARPRPKLSWFAYVNTDTFAAKPSGHDHRTRYEITKKEIS